MDPFHESCMVFIDCSEVHFSIPLLFYPSFPTIPPFNRCPQGLVCLGNVDMHQPKPLAAEVLSRVAVDWWQLPGKNGSVFLPWLTTWRPPLLNCIIYVWLVRHMEALKQLMIPSRAYLAQLWGNGKCRVALSTDHLNVVNRNPWGLRRKWFAEWALDTTVETTTINGTK